MLLELEVRRLSRVTVLLRIIALLFVLCAGTVFAENFGDLAVESESMYAENPSHGYLDYRFVIVNRSGAQSHEVTLEFSSDGSFGGLSDIESISRSVFVGPGAEVSVSIFQPCLPFNGNSVKVSVDGSLQSKVLPLRSAMSYLRRNRSPLILMDRSLDLDDVEDKLGIKDKKSYSRDIFVTESTSQIGKWPVTWLSYTRYDGVIVVGRELTSAPPEVRGALFRYVEAGGTLLTMGECELPLPWSAIQAEAKGEAKSEADVLRINAVGFGRIMVYPGAEPKDMSKAQWTDVRNSWDDGASFWGTEITEEEANKRLPVTGGTAIPIRAMFLLIFAFTICIGPVNLWFLARIKRKIWVFWTIPLFSFVTCGVIFGYAAFAEGWNITAKSEGFTVLDETSHRATSLAWFGFYSPLTYSEGFKFSLDSEVSLCFATYRHNRESRGRRIDWGNTQQLGMGWLAARIPTHFMVRRTETRRERISTTKLSDGGFGVVNGLGRRIKELWLCDFDGKIYRGEDLPPGKENRLTFQGQSHHSNGYEGLRNAYVRDWLEPILGKPKDPFSILSKGTYLADVDGAPFLDNPIKDPTELSEHSIVYGIMKGSAE